MTRTLFKAAAVHSFSVSNEGADSILVENGRIVTAGASEELRSPDVHVVELGDAVITPGLVDSHIHLTEWAVARAQIDLGHADSIEYAAQMASAGREAESGWVQGRGWNPHLWGGAYPTRAVLDAQVSDTPAVLQSHDMHALWLNSEALQRVGIDKDTQDPDGGRILRDENGEPTGVLLENAAQLVVPHLPRYTTSSIIPLVLDAQRALHAYGITGIHSFPGVHLRDPDPFPVLQLMLARNELQLRVLQHISLDVLDDAIRVGLRSGFGNEWLRVGAVKMFLDGALGSRTAWMRRPYEGSADCGVQTMAAADFRDAVARAAAAGIASTVHAIGDAAVMLAFDVLANPDVRVDALPHRVEHVQCLPRECADKLSANIVCSVQPSHLMTDWRAADRHWGARGADTYAFRFMLDRGAVLACGSDAPVEAADPRHGLYAAVARKDLAHEPVAGWYPEQRMTVQEAFAGYTIGPRITAGMSAMSTGLIPGALADFVAWNEDPFRIEPDALLDLTPVVTVVNGDIVYGG